MVRHGKKISGGESYEWIVVLIHYLNVGYGAGFFCCELNVRGYFGLPIVYGAYGNGLSVDTISESP